MFNPSWFNVLVGFCLLAASSRAQAIAAAAETGAEAKNDVVVVGAGIAGLSAALELGRGGASVAVVDMASVFGGHAVMAQGIVNLIATPYQRARDIHDSPELAYRDYIKWGEDANRDWVSYYVEHSNEDIYHWLTKLGVTFDGISQPAGNSVPRVHQVRGRGVALVAPIYRECLGTKGISFRWNVRLDGLLRSAGRVTGVALTNVRTGRSFELRARAVVLATGGFQSNLAMVREVWPKDLPFPPRLLAGAGINAIGSGIEIARANGAAVSRLDHQWNYLSGLPDPRFPGQERGLYAGVASVWVNAEGRRFMPEGISPKYGMPILLRQTRATYWAVFGAEAVRTFSVSGSDWGDRRKVEALILHNPEIVKQGATLEALAANTGLPADALKQTLATFNAMVRRGVDDEFGRFGPGKGPVPRPIVGPPYFAVQFFPITRKSMGGVVIDRACRVLDREQQIIPGLYAAGELTGLAGINGKAGLEGTFLGPSLLTGRVAGRAVLAELGRQPSPPPANRAPIEFRAPPPARQDNQDNQQCMSCHALPALVAESRPGYWHFEKVHRVVLERMFSCNACHSEITGPADPPATMHRIDRANQMLTCATCHKGETP